MHQPAPLLMRRIDTLEDVHNIEEYFDTPEFMFARDLLRYVLGSRTEGLNWVPRGIFANPDTPGRIRSPFTSKIRNAVDAKLDLNENKYHIDFDERFRETICDRDSYLEYCKTIRREFCFEEFTIRNFFRFCVVLAKYAGLSYLYGVADGPEETVKIIISAQNYLKKWNVIGDDFWNRLEAWSDEPEIAETESEDSDKTETSSESGRHMAELES